MGQVHQETGASRCNEALPTNQHRLSKRGVIDCRIDLEKMDLLQSPINTMKYSGVNYIYCNLFV